MNTDTHDQRLRSQILDARTRALAERHTTSGNQKPTVRILAFRLATDVYGLPIEAASRVMSYASCTPVPQATPGLTGIIGVQGAIYNVLETTMLLNGAGMPDTETGHLILLRTPRPRLALRCSRVIGVADMELLNTAETATQRPVTGYGRVPNGAGELRDMSIALLDLGRLVAAFQTDNKERTK